MVNGDVFITHAVCSQFSTPSPTTACVLKSPYGNGVELYIGSKHIGQPITFFVCPRTDYNIGSRISLTPSIIVLNSLYFTRITRHPICNISTSQSNMLFKTPHFGWMIKQSDMNQLREMDSSSRVYSFIQYILPTKYIDCSSRPLWYFFSNNIDQDTFSILERYLPLI